MNGYKQVRVFDKYSIRTLYSVVESNPIIRMKASSTQQQYTIRAFRDNATESKGEKKGWADNDDRDAELKQATLAGGRGGHIASRHNVHIGPQLLAL
jgi:hypothetical protein